VSALERFLALARDRGLPVDERKAERLRSHDRLIRQWSDRVSLVSKGDLEDGLDKHFADSLLLSELIPERSEIVDLGSGAGFPGVPLAVCRDDLHLHLVEVNQKKAFFLKEVRRRLDLSNVQVHLSNWDDLELQADLAAAKATGSLESILPALPHLMKPGGQLLLFSSTAEKEPSPKRIVELDNPLRTSKTYILIYPH
jgi:16S rRNA (guanine527-N7)-methyltransferase